MNESNPSQSLLEAIIELQPTLDTYYRPKGQVRDGVAAYIEGLFGKLWHVATEDFVEAGRWRDVEIGAREQLEADEEASISRLVHNLFVNPNEKQPTAKQAAATQAWVDAMQRPAK